MIAQVVCYGAVVRLAGSQLGRDPPAHALGADALVGGTDDQWRVVAAKAPGALRVHRGLPGGNLLFGSKFATGWKTGQETLASKNRG